MLRQRPRPSRSRHVRARAFSTTFRCPPNSTAVRAPSRSRRGRRSAVASRTSRFRSRTNVRASARFGLKSRARDVGKVTLTSEQSPARRHARGGRPRGVAPHRCRDRVRNGASHTTIVGSLRYLFLLTVRHDRSASADLSDNRHDAGNAKPGSSPRTRADASVVITGHVGGRIARAHAFRNAETGDGATPRSVPAHGR